MPSLFRLRAIQGALVASYFATTLLISGAQAHAQDFGILAPGEAVVTGFSGTISPGTPLPDDADPLDYTFIDPDGPSLVIRNLLPDGPPTGQLIDSPELFTASAADVGQVFAIALDNAPELYGAIAPNIYVAATSAFGLHLVAPDAEGAPIRARTGGVGATFMPGQWGGVGGDTGYPGSIWKIDGETGEVSLFTTIAANTGAGLGDIDYDPSSAQFFVSDLDTGLIYRLSWDGIILDTFDHGITARPEHGLDPVADDGSTIDVGDPAFDTENPDTWGFTQPERRVNGLAVQGGRLYYAVADGPQVWSVRIEADGNFGAPRWELDVADLPSANEITAIAFDPQGRMLLAQRGARVGSYDYGVFAEPGNSSVVRYEREFPDDPATPGLWAPTPDSYVIGFALDGANATGGLALGPNFSETTGRLNGACDAFVWTSGDSLRDSPDLDNPLDPPAQVHGLQGNHHSLVWPQNAPPLLSYFVDHDGNTDDDQSDLKGHVGAIAIWQDCAGSTDAYVVPALPPEGYQPLPLPPPPGFDDDFDPGFRNLTLEKWASPFDCFEGVADWWCNYTIRVENTGDLPYWGPIVVNDYLPDANPGATMDFWNQPPWNCNPTGPAAYQCVRGPVLLHPGDAVTLNATVTLPKALVDYCELTNVAGLGWFWDHDDDPFDDFDMAVSAIAAPGCVPPGGGSDLVLKKTAFPGDCIDTGPTWACSFIVTVQNLGPDDYSGPITITDTLSVDAPATTIGPWGCAQAGPVLTCDILAPPVDAPPGWTSGFVVTANVPKNIGPPLCELDNRANIATPAGGSPTNLVAANDFDDATAVIPDPACLVPQPETDIAVEKTGLGCMPFVYLATPGYLCQWQATFTNVGPDNYNGPFRFDDTSGGATLNTLPLLTPACSGPAFNVTCEAPAVAMPSGVPFPMTFHTFYPDGPDACSATNNISVLTPNPGSAENPAGNDSSSVGQVLPNPVCFVPGLPKLNIQKTATGCAADPASTNWLCDFDIDITNYGTGPQPGPIDVRDFNDKPTAFSGALCAPSGLDQWLCSEPGPLAAGDTWSFQATTTVNPLSVSLADCNVVNTVLITNPLSADPGHISQASQKVPQLFINLGPGPVAVYCDPPSLELTKTAVQTVKSGDGYNATFTVRATSAGPDPYNGTVEVSEDLPDGTSFVSSENWSCVPTIENDVHCSSTFKHMPVGTYTQMTITIHIPTDVAIASQCNVVNTVHASIAPEVLHSDEGLYYTATAAAILPPELCRPPAEVQQCPINRLMPGGDCCEEGLVWTGRQCSAPPPQCPPDSTLSDGQCVCKTGTTGTPGRCEVIQSTPTCPSDSRIVRGECVCDPGTEGRPGRCTPIVEDVAPQCPADSRLVRGECVCDPGTEGRPGRCTPIVEEIVPICPADSRLVRGECVCDPGTEGRPGRCTPIQVAPLCPPDSQLVRGECVCGPGTEGRPGRCRPIVEDITPACPKDSQLVRGQCVCLPGTEGAPGQCRQPTVETNPTCPRDSEMVRGQCVCTPPTVGSPGKCATPELPQLQLRAPLRALPGISVN